VNIHSQTEIEAVNSMLETIGELPVSSIDAGGNLDAAIARDTLRQVSREVQQMGWYFNTEENYDLMPDTNGTIYLPEEIISVDIEPRNNMNMTEVAERGRRLYNMTDHSYFFPDKISATVTVMLPFEELPETAKSYITVRASRLFLSRTVGSETLQAFTQQDEMTTYAALRREQVRKTDRVFLSYHRKSHDGMNTISRVLDRRI
jgi:hypothetical protein